MQQQYGARIDNSTLQKQLICGDMKPVYGYDIMEYNPRRQATHPILRLYQGLVSNQEPGLQGRTKT